MSPESAQNSCKMLVITLTLVGLALVKSNTLSVKNKCESLGPFLQIENRLPIPILHNILNHVAQSLHIEDKEIRGKRIPLS
ncbi:hypothetical protein GYH30_027592 [Glycine max]|nr:hypothetical protein GYH30_027592 [Glycine max]